MRNLDEYEQKIVKELIKNPRNSDNQISKITKIPLKTVNRKRKRLEQENLLYYFAFLNNGQTGTGLFSTAKLYSIKLKSGISQKTVLEELSKKELVDKYLTYHAKHMSLTMVGERDGNVVLIFLLESFKDSDINEIYHNELVPLLTQLFGDDSITSTEVTTICCPLRILHNYLLHLNMENGIIKKDWPDKAIFVSEKFESTPQ